MNIAVFVYDFPHKKSQDYLFRLWVEGWTPLCVIGAPRLRLNVGPSPKTRTKARHTGLIHPEFICRRWGVPYVVNAHNDAKTKEVLEQSQIDVVVIGGSRIIKNPVLGAPKIGIINFHPGLIPEARGLNALQWSVYKGLPPGVTAHFIDERVDAGWIIERAIVPVYEDDSWVDLSLRLSETEVDLLPGVLKKVDEHRRKEVFDYVEDTSKAQQMTAGIEDEVNRRFDDWRKKMAAGGAVSPAAARPARLRS